MALQSDQRTGPLSGYKILDFTRALAGPYGAMLLADLGATVIKIEQPEGDCIRTNGPFLDNEKKDGGLGGFFNSINRNKNGVVLNLKDPRCQKIAHQLAEECDAVIMNFSSPNIPKKYKIDFDTLHAINPKLVYVALCGFGTNAVVGSDYVEKPTVDMMIQAASGFMSITGKNENEMYKAGPGIGDTYPGTLGIVALLAALVNAKDTGKGQYVEVAMLDALMLLSERMIYQYSYTGKIPTPIGNGHPHHAPYSLYRAKDGYVAISAHPIKYWDHLVNAIGCDILRNDPRFKDTTSRIKNIEELTKLIEAFTSQRTKAECMEIFDKHNCLAAPCNNAKDLYESPHVKKREMLVQIEGDADTHKMVTVAASPMKFSKTKTQVVKRAPLLGEDTARILSQLGYSQQEIETLDAEGAIYVKK